MPELQQLHRQLSRELNAEARFLERIGPLPAGAPARRPPLAFAGGVLACVPTIYVMVMNGANGGMAAGLFAAAGPMPRFWGLITPHGLLELTAIFIAGGAGLLLYGIGWIAMPEAEEGVEDGEPAPGDAAPAGTAGGGRREPAPNPPPRGHRAA